jgi:hypothetical protein
VAVAIEDSATSRTSVSAFFSPSLLGGSRRAERERANGWRMLRRRRRRRRRWQASSLPRLVVRETSTRGYIQL